MPRFRCAATVFVEVDATSYDQAEERVLSVLELAAHGLDSTTNSGHAEVTDRDVTSIERLADD